MHGLGTSFYPTLSRWTQLTNMRSLSNTEEGQQLALTTEEEEELGPTQIVIEMKLAIPFSQTKKSTNYQVSETAGQDTDADGDEDVGRIPQTLIPICPETRSISYRTMTGVSQNKLKFMV